MRKFLLFAAVGAVLALACACDKNKVEEVNGRIDSLEQRVAALESTVSAINENTIAVRKLVGDGVTIAGYENTSTGYEITLSDGQVLKITFGAGLEGLVPVLGIDDDGCWIVSTDGGATWSAVPGAGNVREGDGVVPLVQVDEYGYWNFSVDGGATWQKIYNPSGLPISANDGRETAGSYSFFTYVEYHEDDMRLHFLLNTGGSFAVPVLGTYYVRLNQYEEGDKIFSGETLTFPVEHSHVASAVWKSVPEGFTARFADEGMTFTAPEDGEAGIKEFELLVFSDEGYTKVYTFRLDYDPDLIFWDDFDRSFPVEEDGVVWNAPDPKRWTLYARSNSETTRYLSQSYENVYVEPEQGRMFLTSTKKGDEYRAAGITTQNRITFGNCRVEVRAFMIKNAQGGWHAIWLNTQSLSWPNGGEIDIMEHINKETIAYQTTHSPYTVYDASAYDYTDPLYYDYFKAAAFPQQQGKPTYDPTDYHTFGVDVTDDWILYHIDGEITTKYPNMHWNSEEDITNLSWKAFSDYYDIQDERTGGIPARTDEAVVREVLRKPNWDKQWPFQNSDWYLLINIALGGTWAGEIKDSELPVNMYVDWVRITPLDKAPQLPEKQK